MDSLKDSLLAQVHQAERAYKTYDLLLHRHQEQLRQRATLSERMRSYGTRAVTLSDVQAQAGAFVTAALAACERAAGHESVYYQQAQRYAEHIGVIGAMAGASEQHMQSLSGVLKSLRQAIDHDYLRSVRQLIHAEVFTDILEMADYLHEQGYKDAAAMMAGGVLEQHIRQLCAAHTIPTSDPDATTGKMRPRPTERLNAELARAGAYDKGAQKNITGWLDLRNKAAHGRYSEYSLEDVGPFIQGIRLFVRQHPA